MELISGMTTAEYNQCIDNYADNVYRFILKNIKNEDNARDIVQDTFLKMWEKAGDIMAEKARSYLFTAAYHNMIDFIRKQKITFDIGEVRLESPYSVNEFPDLKKILDNALAQVPEIQRSVILLRDYEGYSYKEIGEITDLSETQVKVYIYRARTFLKNFLVRIDRVI